jgi:hypothetical protein
MADVSKKIIKKGVELCSITDFKKRHNGLSGQAVDYAISKGLVDYVQVGKIRFIALTDRSLAYSPKIDKRRTELV